MKKILLLLCIVCLLCSCATAGKTGSGYEDTDNTEKKSGGGITSENIDNALAINCAVGNPIACILSVPFRIIDAIDFIGDVTGLKTKSSNKETEETKKEEK